MIFCLLEFDASSKFKIPPKKTTDPGGASPPALDTERKSTVISDTLNACRTESVFYCMGCSECTFHKSPSCKIAFRLSAFVDALEVQLLGVILRPSYARGKSAYEIRSK
jgi:hypothetical protein